MSNNPSGDYSPAARGKQVNMDECERILCFRHVPGTKCEGTQCQALNMTEHEERMPGAKELRINGVQALRLQFHYTADQTMGNRLLSHLLNLETNYLSEHPGEQTIGKVPTWKLNWTVGDRKVCHHCWAAAAGLLASPQLTQRKSVFKNAITAYNEGLEVMPQRNKQSRNRKSVDTTASNKDEKLYSAIAWIVQFISEEEGNSQQKTGDTHEHLQGFTRHRLFETYQKWHADPENNVGGTLGKMCSRTTFHRQCDPNRTCNPIDNPNHGSAPKSTLTFSITLKVVIIRKSITNEIAEHQT